MVKLKYTLLVILYTIVANAQNNIKPYEQVAIDYFSNNIAESYSDLDHFIFKGDLETTSPVPYSFCMPLEKIDGYQREDNTMKINPPYPKVVRKLDIFKRLFSSKSKIAQLYVFKHYPKEENVVVVIYLSSKNMDDYYSILIDKTSKQVIDYCKKTYYE